MTVIGSIAATASVKVQRTGTGSEPACSGLERIILKGDGEEVAGENGRNAGEKESTDPGSARPTQFTRLCFIEFKLPF